MEDERILIERAKEGNEEAFSDLIGIYKNYIFAIILNFIKDYDEVENIAQEVCLQLYVSLPKYDQQNFKAWLGRIATNKSIDWLRKKKAKYKDEVLDEANLDRNIIEKENPESLMLEKERRERLNKVLNSMPDIYRLTLEKFYFEEKSYDEIAVEDGVSSKTVASRLYRAKKLLKEKWREENAL
ncbi:MAG: sigma-70 family RNA polymerase sigma factor [Tissierellia bacterium]|nr:sigma-70 family RNA polymerase sigma factor [Tissierellia bacterium]